MSRILVVDDDPISADLVSNVLERAGYDVCTASDGWQACQLVQQEQFAAIVTDEMMSAMNGLELCGVVRKLGIQIPIIILSSLEEQLNQPAICEQFGLVAVLGKPLVPPLLLYILEAHLAQTQPEAGQCDSRLPTTTLV